MKVQWIAFGLLASSLGFSGEETSTTSTDHCYCACSTCCCTSPTPDPCVDCLSFLPQWYNMNCDWGVYLTGDFLYWAAKETNTAYASKNQTVPLGEDPTDSTEILLFSPTTFDCFGTQWDPGFRAGIGYKSECDGWDFGLLWTYYRNSKREKQLVDNPPILLPVNGDSAFLNPWVDHDVTSVFNSVKGSWKFLLNNFDLVLGKRYWTSKYFTLRPYGGVRGLWAQTTLTTKSRRDDYLDSIFSTTVKNRYEKDEFVNTAYGAGILVGLEPTWFFNPCISLYTNSDIALVWSNHRVKKWEKNSNTDTATSFTITTDGTPQSVSESTYRTPILDLAAGLRWETYACEDRLHFEIDLGWEYHVMFHLNDRYQIRNVQIAAVAADTRQIDGVQYFTETHHDVSFGGPILHLRFDF